MSHEPECGYSTGNEYEGCLCEMICAAYRRGREAAAQAVMRLIINNPTGSAGLTDAVAAARGEA